MHNGPRKIFIATLYCLGVLFERGFALTTGHWGPEEHRTAAALGL